MGFSKRYTFCRRCYSVPSHHSTFKTNFKVTWSSHQITWLSFAWDAPSTASSRFGLGACLSLPAQAEARAPASEALQLRLGPGMLRDQNAPKGAFCRGHNQATIPSVKHRNTSLASAIAAHVSGPQLSPCLIQLVGIKSQCFLVLFDSIIACRIQ
jgi:hypothetical protein